MAKLGFVGLGAMGSAIVERLLDAGHTVTGYNRTKSKAEPLLDAGMLWAESPREAAEASDVVFSMVFDEDAVRAVATGPDGIFAGLSAGKIYLDMSTVGPSIIHELAPQAAERGAHMLDAPVSGSPITVRQGKLAFMVGGERAAFERIEPILLDIGPRATYLGESGTAAVMKIALNLSIPVQLLALYEGVVLAEKYGIARETALDVMLNSAIASPAMQYRGPFALELPEEPLFTLTGQRKDLAMALDMGRAKDVALPTAAATDQIMSAAGAAGYADEDFAAIFNVLADLAGLTD